MRGTTAVNNDQLGYAGDAAERPMCPACRSGRLHPYAVVFEFPTVINGFHFTSERMDFLEGWVAVCTGSRDYNRAMKAHYEKDGAVWDEEGEIEDEPPCGFSMPLTPKTHRWRAAPTGGVEG